MPIEPRIFLFVLAGLALWASVELERRLKHYPLSLPMLYVGLGWLLFALPLGLPVLDPVGEEAHAKAAEYLTEFIVIVSLVGAGIAIDRPLTWKGWRQVWSLLGITMPLTILVVGWLGWAWLGMAPATALLLAAALSPTDPVLARGVQVGPPGERARDDVRFNLTVEAGINDGLAFPFTYLALAAVGMAGVGGWLGEWAALDVLWRIPAGVAVGWAIGRFGGWYVFERSEETDEEGHANRRARTNEGLIVMGTLFTAYGLAEAIGGYGFLAVFAGAVRAKQFESRSNYHEIAHHFIDQVEKVVLVAMLLGFGGLLASGVLDALTWEGALLGLVILLVIRPLAGIAGMLRYPLPWAGRWAIAFLGIRGMGTLYYIAYGQNHADFAGIEAVWAVAAFTILGSIILHGASAEFIMRWLCRRGISGSGQPV